jgi:phosphomevalonate kinase
MITGEYAVLDGAEAIVAAVDRRAFVRVAGSGAASQVITQGTPQGTYGIGAARIKHDPASLPGVISPEATAAFSEAEARLGRYSHESSGGALQVLVEASSMRQGDSKLGLGSSAAGAAAAAGLVFAAHGRDLSELEVRKQVLEAAFAGHKAISPKGSGADVAASVLGGFVRFRRLGEVIEAHPVAWPASVCVRVVWTGKPARTSDFVAKVDALGVANPTLHRERMRALGAEADRFVSAVIASDTAGLLESTHAYGLAMGELGAAAGIEIVTDTLREVANVARQAGGAAKPSGAGGGDVALALFADEVSAGRFGQMCAQAGLSVLSVELGAAGVMRHAPSSEAV